jgi:hypothetical protein
MSEEVYTKLTNESGEWLSVPFTDEEIADLEANREAIDLNLIPVRQERNQRLQVTDWTDLPNAPLTAPKKAEWQTYRQELRDYPSLSDRISTLPEWPTPPE